MTVLLNMDEVRLLIANDLATSTGERGVPISDAYERLRVWRARVGRVTDGEPYEFEAHIESLAAVLGEAFVWPFEPITVRDRRVLIDGHHRVLAALRVGWKAPIPAEEPWWVDCVGE